MNEDIQISSHNKIQREYYETRTTKENWRVTPQLTPYISNHIEKFLAFARLKKNSRILDVGCGMGKFTLLLANMGFKIEGLDLSPMLLEELSKNNDTGHKVPTYCTDILNPPNELIKVFDTITGFFMLHHLLDINIAFKKINSLLKEGGDVIFLDVNPYCILYYFQIVLSPSIMCSSLICANEIAIRILAISSWGDFPTMSLKKDLLKNVK